MNHIFRSAGIVAALSVISRLLGFFRDAVIAAVFGASKSLDAFFIAFRIPNLFRRLASEGVLSVSFIPIISEHRLLYGEKAADRFMSNILTLSFILFSAVIIPSVLFSGHITSIIAFGFIGGDLRAETSLLSKILIPYILFAVISSLFAGYLNSKRIFYASAMSPIALNLAIIAGAVISSHFFNISAVYLAYGMLLGGIFQCLVQMPALKKSGFKFNISFDVKHPIVIKFFRSSLPFILAASVYQINVVINAIIASSLPAGSVSWLYFADRLTELSLSVFVYSISNVLLPEISELAAKGDKKKVGRLFSDSIRASLFIALPAAGVLICAGYPIVSALFIRGNFSHEDALMTSRALIFSGIGIIPLSLIRMQLPLILSSNKEKTALLSAAAACLINIILGMLLIRTSLQHAGLALSNSIAVAVQAAVMSAAVRKSGYHIDKEIIFWILRILTAAAAVCAVIFSALSRIDWQNEPSVYRIFMLSAVLSSGGILYFILCSVMKIREARKTIAFAGAFIQNKKAER